MNIILSFICVAFLLLFSDKMYGQDANVIPFQGQLANQYGQVISPTNSVNMVFRLYQQPVGGVAIWEESQSKISVNSGRFSVLLGSRTQLPSYNYFNSTLYLGITVDDGNPQTADVEMRPRQALVPVISARYAQSADTLRGYDWSVLFGTNNPVDGKILGTKLANETITGIQIASNTITAEKIDNYTISSNQIAIGSISISNLSSLIAEALNPPGTIVAFGGDTNRIPIGWLLCNGNGLAISNYPRLYATISTNWGQGYIDGIKVGDFSLPDLRGMFLRGVNGTRKDDWMDPEADSRTSYNTGDGGNFVGSYQKDQIIHHEHLLETAASQNWQTSASISDPIARAPYPVNWDTKGMSESGGSETRPKNAYVNYIIKY